MLANRFWQGAVANLSVEHFLELDVAAGNRVADDDNIEIGRDVLGVIPGQGWNPLRLEKVAHWRIDVLIGAPHLEAFAFEHRGNCCHRRAADANEMNFGGQPYSTAASS